jgi:predicted dehydrogenase
LVIRRLPVALIGATDHANHFVPLLNTFEPVEIVGVWDYDAETAQEFARANGIDRVFDNPEDALELAQAVVIPMHGRLPKRGERWGDAPSDHLRLARIFLESGKAVFATRPFATKVRDAEEMIRLAQANDAPIMSCSSLRYDRQVQRLRRLVRSGSLGRVRTWFSSVRTNFPDRPVTIGFYGVHGIEMSYAVIGQGAEWVQTTTTSVRGEDRKTSVFTVKFDEGRVMVGQLIDGSSAGGYRISVYGENGVADAEPEVSYAALPYKPWVKASTEKSRDNYFRIMFHEFVKMVKSGEPPIAYSELVEITRVLAAAETSARSGKRIYLSDL